jgi:MFS transporter, MHS family, proline/betaine transporter
MSIETVVVSQTTAQPTQLNNIFLPVFASAFGWALDLFDLFILLFVAPTLGRLFFPASNPLLSLAAVYASFAVTLLLRPIGSAVFGSYADRSGRRKSMTVSVIGVGTITFLMGLLPTINSVGMLAPALFLILRLLQGVFVGGVIATTHTVGTEFVPTRWRGTISGIVGTSGGGLGAVLASLAFSVAATIFSGGAFDEWGWRAMFMCGILSSLLGLVVFLYLDESPAWLKTQAAKSVAAHAPASDRTWQSPVRQVVRGGYRTIFLLNLLVTGGAGSAYYVTAGYLPTFLKLVNKVPNTTAALILLGASFFAMIGGPFIGFMSDKLGRRRTLFLVAIGGLISLPPVLIHFAQLGQNDIGSITISATVISFFGLSALAPIPILLNEQFPAELRASGTGLSWNVGFAIGGLMPTFVSLFSGGADGLPKSVISFGTASFVVLAIGALVIPEKPLRFPSTG